MVGSGTLPGRSTLGDTEIGSAAAIAFARSGCDVAIGYLPDEEADYQRGDPVDRGGGQKAIPLPGDIKQETLSVSSSVIDGFGDNGLIVIQFDPDWGMVTGVVPGARELVDAAGLQSFP